MFLDFYFALRGLDVEVSPTEWLTLMEALQKGLHNNNSEDFYYLARSILIKDVAHYDAYDRAFLHVFADMEIPDDSATREEILKWLESGLGPYRLGPAELEKMRRLTLEELLAELEERLRTQKGPHHGGHHWIGTGGTSPFGTRGFHPTGISFSEERGEGNAVLSAFSRRYRNLRNDLALDVRQMSVALKRLRVLRKSPSDGVLDIEETVDRTCRNGGEIEMVFGSERENQVRLILAMDTGGSMEPHRLLCETMFSAANGINHFKEFKAYYFHNCIYDNLYLDVEAGTHITVEELIKNSTGGNYRLIIVGDAAMAPYELLIPNGILERQRTSGIKGIDRLKALASAFPGSVWLNPERESSWGFYRTTGFIREVFPMYPLTVAGLEQAVKELV